MISKQGILRKMVSIGPTRWVLLVVSNLLGKNQKIPVIDNDILTYFDNSEALRGLKFDGYFGGFSLNEESLTALRNKCSESIAYSKTDPSQTLQVNSENPQNPIVGHFQFQYNNIEEWDSVKQIIYSDKIVALAKDYLGKEPVIHNVTIWWSFPLKDEEGEFIESPFYGYHYDIDDVKFVKLFVYLNDVDEETGPHVILSGTHKNKGLFEIKNRRLSDEVAEQRYSGKKRVMMGPAGTAFFEDTFTYHKGTNPQKPRLLFQVEYGISKTKLG